MTALAPYVIRRGAARAVERYTHALGVDPFGHLWILSTRREALSVGGRSSGGSRR